MLNKEVRQLALALFQVAKEHENVTILNENIQAFTTTWQEVQASLQVADISILTKKQQRGILHLILQAINAESILVTFMDVLVDSNKTNLLTTFLANWRGLEQEFQGYQKIEVVTAVPLSLAQEEQIKLKLSKYIGEKFFLEKKIDEQIIAGLIIRGANFEFNDSILGKLNNILTSFKGALFNE